MRRGSTHRRPGSRRQEGVALVLAILVVAAAALVALTMAGRARRGVTDAALDRASSTARAAASGGIERARWALARDRAYTGESLQVGDSEVVISVPDGECVVAVATSRSGVAGVSATHRIEADVVCNDDDGLPRIRAWRESR